MEILAMIGGAGTLYGYIDPGTGAIILQVLVAGLFAIGVMCRRLLIAPILALFSRNRRGK